MRSSTLASIALVAISFACSETEPRTPTDILLSAVDTVRSLNAEVPMNAVVRDQRQQPIPDAGISEWTSSDPAVATISSTGRLISLTNGSTTITAKSGSLSATTMVRVHQRVSTVAVSGATGFASLGQTAQLAAVAKDAGGTDVAGRAISWSSSNAAAITVDAATGLATAVAPGSSTISATVEGIAGTLPLAVVQVPASLVINGSTDTLRALGTTRSLTVAVKDAGGSAIASPTATWSSTSAILTVSSTVSTEGTATAVGNGTAYVRVQAGSVADSVKLTVRQAADPSKSTISLAHPLLLVGDTTTATLVTRDSRDNALTISGGTATFFTNDTVGTPSTGAFLPVTDHGNGTYTARWAANGIGATVSLNATINGATVGTSQFLRVVGFTKVGTYGPPYSRSCGIITTGDMYCWGAREQGLRGTGVTVATVTEPTPTLVSGGKTWSALDLGMTAACGITTSSRLYCWGEGNNGDLGDGQSVNVVSTPSLSLGDSTVIAVDLGESRGPCALMQSHRAMCWGSGTWGRLGNGSDTAVLNPVTPTGGHRFSAIASSFAGTCAVTDAGTTMCWGNWGALGLGAEANAPDRCPTVGCAKNPVAVQGALTFMPRIARDGNDACAMTVSDSTTYCWGRFNRTPTAKVGAPRFTRLDVGSGDFCGIATNGALWCWGNNKAGRLQQPPDVAVEVHTPVNVATGQSWTDLSMAELHMCAIAANGNAWCWGENDKGQLGNRGTAKSYTPVRVRLFVP